jgi:hypothetical protein
MRGLQIGTRGCEVVPTWQRERVTQQEHPRALDDVPQDVVRQQTGLQLALHESRCTPRLDTPQLRLESRVLVRDLDFGRSAAQFGTLVTVEA